MGGERGEVGGGCGLCRAERQKLREAADDGARIRHNGERPTGRVSKDGTHVHGRRAA